MVSRSVIKDKDDVLAIVGEALSALGRDDGIFSYGAVEDGKSGAQLIYFDLPRVSPLQFNIRLDRGISRDETVAIVQKAIQERIDLTASSAGAGQNFELS